MCSHCTTRTNAKPTSSRSCSDETRPFMNGSGFTSTVSALRRRSSHLVGWRARSRSSRRTRRGVVPDTIAWCAHPADLVANKLTVGREKDMAFCRAVLRQRLVNPADVAELIEQIEGIAPASRQMARQVTAAHALPTVPLSPKSIRVPASTSRRRRSTTCQRSTTQITNDIRRLPDQESRKPTICQRNVNDTATNSRLRGTTEVLTEAVERAVTSHNSLPPSTRAYAKTHIEVHDYLAPGPLFRKMHTPPPTKPSASTSDRAADLAGGRPHSENGVTPAVCRSRDGSGVFDQYPI